jgi:uncharacterized membrane protein
LISLAALLNLTDAIVIIIPAIITIILAWRIKNAIGPLRILTTLLALFLVVHGIFHFSAFYNAQYNSAWAGFLGDVFIQPLSWVILVIFSAYYLKTAG